MLDNYYMSNVNKFIENENFIVWKFLTKLDQCEKQNRPILYIYSLMTRAYGCYFNDDNIIDYLNNEGFDVFLIDWGKTHLFTLEGWTLEDYANHLEKIIDIIKKEYEVPKVNVFCTCLGGVILSNLLSLKGKIACDKFHRIAFYGVPIFGLRDLGMAKTQINFYNIMKPYENLFKNFGVSLFFLDLLILYSSSLSMVYSTWSEFFSENKNDSFYKILNWTYDDRWVPYSAIMQLIRYVFFPSLKNHGFIFWKNTANIHFLNIVGIDDMVVKPSASIIEFNSQIPSRFKTFEQMILKTDHFMFARPGFKKEKEKIAHWFSGKLTS